jgi:RNA polymerase sigma factor (sigma-70 family)
VTRLITARLRRLGAYDLGDEWRDLCQEVVWALVRAVRDGRAPQADKVNAYVSAIVQNQLVTWLRKHKTATAALDDGDVPADDLASAVTDRAAAGEREERFAAKQALARLSRDWQALLVAHYVEGRTIDTLVAASGKSRATLNRELGRARSAFRAALMEEGGVAAPAEVAGADEGEVT